MYMFKIKERGSTVSREIVAGITTVLAMAYILALNPSILADGTGMVWSKVFTATAISSAIATLVMAFVANLPVALAPGLGLNAFFTYSVVLGMGCSWQLALTAVLLEGVLFIILSLVGIREAIIKSIPNSIKKAVSVGIGLFITIIGLANAGIVSGDTGTLIGFVNFDLQHSAALVAVIGLIITIILYILKVPGAILIGIAITTIIGIPFGVTNIPENFSIISKPDSPYFFQFDFKGIAIDPVTGSFSGAVIGKFIVIFFTFLFTDMFDTLGTLMGIAEQGNLKDKDGNIVNAKGALLSDAVGTVTGACLGTSTVTSFVESSSGVAAGGRTGLSSLVTAVFFLLALFFNDVFAIIPAAATAPALIFVGYLMMKSVTGIDFTDPTEGIPAFITIMVMPFAYTISKGIAWGIISYVICKVAGKKAKSVSVVTWILAVIFIADIIFEAVK
ncbi:MAG: NCS2 family permease [Treponema sp.]|nr:NCS2 family permease [Treponema sp.]